jgi:hypothetical protein
MINIRDALLRVRRSRGGSLRRRRVRDAGLARPDRLTALGLTPSDVIQAIKEQNLQAPAGQVGAAPSPPGQEFTYTVEGPAAGEPREFENIILKQSSGGRRARIKDVGRAELGSENYRPSDGDREGLDGQWLEGRRRRSRSTCCRAQPARVGGGDLSHAQSEHRFFPDDVAYEIVYDTTPAVEASHRAILHTCRGVHPGEPGGVRLPPELPRHDHPAAHGPVSLIGTFIFFPLLGFSINTLSMFGLVLAIGIVVDDAIVVVEAVMHHIEHGKTPHDGHRPGYEGGLRPGGGDRADSLGGVRAGALLGGLTGRLIPAVRAHHRHLGAPVGLPGAESGPALCAMSSSRPRRPAGRWAPSTAASTACST